MNAMPTCWIIAGPNGAGKTTFALKYLPALANCRRFINADLIAAGLSPLAPDQQLMAASRIFLREIEESIAAEKDFAFETTLAGRSYIKLVSRLLAQGWRVELIYLALPSAETSRLRVAERVLHGGHDIPAADIARRFPRSLHNLIHLFAPLTSQTRCFMNNGAAPELVFQQVGGMRSVSNAGLFELLSAEGSVMKVDMQIPTPLATAQPLSTDTQAMLECLQLTATETLERKRRLGHYAVLWSDDGPVLVGEDAPASF